MCAAPAVRGVQNVHLPSSAHRFRVCSILVGVPTFLVYSALFLVGVPTGEVRMTRHGKALQGTDHFRVFFLFCWVCVAVYVYSEFRYSINRF